MGLQAVGEGEEGHLELLGVEVQKEPHQGVGEGEGHQGEDFEAKFLVLAEMVCLERGPNNSGYVNVLICIILITLKNCTYIW